MELLVGKEIGAPSIFDLLHAIIDYGEINSPPFNNWQQGSTPENAGPEDLKSGPLLHSKSRPARSKNRRQMQTSEDIGQTSQSS